MINRVKVVSDSADNGFFFSQGAEGSFEQGPKLPEAQVLFDTGEYNSDDDSIWYVPIVDLEEV